MVAVNLAVNEHAEAGQTPGSLGGVVGNDRARYPDSQARPSASLCAFVGSSGRMKEGKSEVVQGQNARSDAGWGDLEARLVALVPCSSGNSLIRYLERHTFDCNYWVDGY